MNIDYTPLDTQPTDQQINAFRQLSNRAEYYYAKSLGWSYVFVLIMAGIGGFVGGLLPGVVVGVATDNLLFIWLTAIVIAIAAVLVAQLMYRYKEKAMLMYGSKLYLFMQANPGLMWRAATPEEDNGVIFKQTNTRRPGFVMEAVDKSFRIGNYQYEITTHRGDSYDIDVYKWGYLALQLNRQLPNMILDAKGNDKNFLQTIVEGQNNNLPINLQSAQKLSLEGDFDKYFTLYAPEAYRQDALYVFTPDLMALLIDHSHVLDVEIVDSTMYFYVQGGIDLAESTLLRRLISLVDVVGAKALRQTDHYADQRVGNPSANVVAAPGKRLSSKTWTVATVVSLAFAVLGWLSLLVGQF